MTSITRTYLCIKFLIKHRWHRFGDCFTVTDWILETSKKSEIEMSDFLSINTCEGRWSEMAVFRGRKNWNPHGIKSGQCSREFWREWFRMFSDRINIPGHLHLRGNISVCYFSYVCRQPKKVETSNKLGSAVEADTAGVDSWPPAASSSPSEGSQCRIHAWSEEKLHNIYLILF